MLRRIMEPVCGEAARRRCALKGPRRVLLSAALLAALTSAACTSESTISGTTNWVLCMDSSDCELHGGSQCSGDGYCLDSSGHRIVIESDVTLTAVVRETSPGGPPGIAAEWKNGTDQPIFLRGCMTVDGWYREGAEWLEYGAFAQCAAEGTAVMVAPGQTYLDASMLPPERGDDVWRLVGPYAVGCTPGETLSQGGCTEMFEMTSVNEVSP